LNESGLLPDLVEVNSRAQHRFRLHYSRRHRRS
jgi:hypothetical protein